jgi:hypothetical protein
MCMKKGLSKLILWVAPALLLIAGLWWRSTVSRNVISEQFIPDTILDPEEHGVFTISSKSELQRLENMIHKQVDSTSSAWDRLGVSAYAVATQGRSVNYAKRLHGGLNTVILRPHSGSNVVFITLIDGDPNLNVKYGP